MKETSQFVSIELDQHILHSLTKEQLIDILTKKEIPITIFQSNLAPLEALIKYLKEVLNLTTTEIANNLNRNYKTIHTTYTKVKHLPLIYNKTNLKIPLSIFKKENLSILESLTVYLNQTLNLSKKQIADLLNKDQRTIWTTINRATKKWKT